MPLPDFNNDVPLWTTLLAASGAITATAAAIMANLQARRQHREHQKEKRWLLERAQLELIGVADEADRYALEGVEQPGTQAVRTIFPGFDFTMGGKYRDERPLRDTPNVTYAPWTPDVVESLAAYQESGTLHPYTCDVDHAHGKLIPDTEGWRCRVCDYTQSWALRYVANGSWRRDHERMVGAFRAPEPVRSRRDVWLSFAQRRLGLFQSTMAKPHKGEQ